MKQIANELRVGLRTLAGRLSSTGGWAVSHSPARRLVGVVGVALALALGSGAAQARTFQGEYVAFGVGTLPCSQYTAARAAGGEVMLRMSSFIEGYLSAFNLIVPNTYDILAGKDIAEAYQWLDRHCRANPDMSLTDSVASLTVHLYPTRSNMRQPPGGAR